MIIHAITFHFNPKLKAKTRSIFLTFLALIPVYGLTYFFLPPDPILTLLLDPSTNDSWERGTMELVNFLMGLVFYAFLFLGYLEFYFTADRSMTFRMLALLADFPERSMTEEDFLEHYDTDRIIRRRLDDMTWGGYLIKDRDCYILTTKGQLIQKFYGWVIHFLNLGKF